MVVETSKGKLPVRFGMSALAKFGDMTGKTMNEVFKSLENFGKLQLSELLAFVYVGLVDGARFAGEECLIKTTEEAGDLIDETPGLLQKMLEVYIGEQETEKDSSKKK